MCGDADQPWRSGLAWAAPWRAGAGGAAAVTCGRASERAGPGDDTAAALAPRQPPAHPCCPAAWLGASRLAAQPLQSARVLPSATCPCVAAAGSCGPGGPGGPVTRPALLAHACATVTGGSGLLPISCSQRSSANSSCPRLALKPAPTGSGAESRPETGEASPAHSRPAPAELHAPACGPSHTQCEIHPIARPAQRSRESMQATPQTHIVPLPTCKRLAISRAQDLKAQRPEALRLEPYSPGEHWQLIQGNNRRASRHGQHGIYRRCRLRASKGDVVQAPLTPPPVGPADNAGCRDLYG